MKKVVLLMLLSLSLLSSCSVKTGTQCTPIIEKVPVKCTPPEVPESKLEIITENDTYEERLRKLIHNYGKLREENKLLRNSIEVCK